MPRRQAAVANSTQAAALPSSTADCGEQQELSVTVRPQPRAAAVAAFVQSFLPSSLAAGISIDIVRFDSGGNPHVAAEALEWVLQGLNYPLPADHSLEAAPAAPRAIHLLVNRLEGTEPLVISVQPHRAVREVKSLIQESFGIPPRCQTLVVPFRRMPLEKESKSLKEYGICSQGSLLVLLVTEEPQADRRRLWSRLVEMDDYTEGEVAAVYSRTHKMWCLGTLTEVHEDGVFVDYSGRTASRQSSCRGAMATTFVSH